MTGVKTLTGCFRVYLVIVAKPETTGNRISEKEKIFKTEIMLLGPGANDFIILVAVKTNSTRVPNNVIFIFIHNISS